jgi:hypothetical protein
MKHPRNKFVIRRSSGHPGCRSTTVIATRENLAALADEIKVKLADGYKPPFVTHEATEEHGASSRIYLQFEPATGEEIDALHTPRNAIWGVLIRPALGLLIGVLAIIGAARFWHWLSSGSW